MTTLRFAIAGAITLAGATSSLTIHHQAQAKLRENDAVAGRQSAQLVERTAEHQRLTTLIARANNAPADDRIAELVKLRGEAEALRKRTNELAKQWAEKGRSPELQAAALRDFYKEEGNREAKHTRRYLASPDQKAQDARTLTVALGNYASDHEGEIPASLGQLAPYLPENERHLAGTTQFELVYQGSLNELTEVPLAAVALIRERQAGLTYDGKQSRLYTFVNANGSWPDMVESDDNFQAWEAAHVIPPPANRQ